MDQGGAGSLEVCRVKRVLARMDYGISVSTEEEGRYPVLKMGHLQDGEIVLFKIWTLSTKSMTTSLLETNDLLYNRTNSPDQVGKAAIFRVQSGCHFAWIVVCVSNHRVKLAVSVLCLSRLYEGFLASRGDGRFRHQQSNLNYIRYWHEVHTACRP